MQLPPPHHHHQSTWQRHLMFQRAVLVCPMSSHMTAVYCIKISTSYQILRPQKQVGTYPPIRTAGRSIPQISHGQWLTGLAWAWCSKLSLTKPHLFWFKHITSAIYISYPPTNKKTHTHEWTLQVKAEKSSVRHLQTERNLHYLNQNHWYCYNIMHFKNSENLAALAKLFPNILPGPALNNPLMQFLIAK